MERIPIPLGYGHKANRERQMHKHTVKRTHIDTLEGISGGQCLTQLYVLIVSEDEDDVGSHIADVAVPLKPRPEAVSGQVAGAFGHGQDSHQDEEEEEEEEKREQGGQPPPCHHYSAVTSSVLRFTRGSLQLPHSA